MIFGEAGHTDTSVRVGARCGQQRQAARKSAAQVNRRHLAVKTGDMKGLLAEARRRVVDQPFPGPPVAA